LTVSPHAFQWSPSGAPPAWASSTSGKGKCGDSPSLLEFQICTGPLGVGLGPWGSARDPRASGPQRAPNDPRRPQNRKAGPEQTWTSVDPRLLRSMIREALNTGPLLHCTARARCASTQRGQHRCTARLGGVRRTDNGRHGLFGCVLRLYARQRCRGFRHGCRRHVDVDNFLLKDPGVLERTPGSF